MVERSIIQGQGEKKLEPFDIVEITRIIKGIEIPKDKEDVSIRRKARPCELDENINKEPEMPTSFSNLRKIKYWNQFTNRSSIIKKIQLLIRVGFFTRY